jgi:HSP20 family protein
MQVKIATTRKPEAAQNSPYPVYSPFRLFDEFYRDWAQRTSHPEAESWKPAVDILERDGNLILCAEIPGVTEKDIDLKLEGNVLTIKGEKKQSPQADGFTVYQLESFYGQFSRSFTLPETVDAEKISASYRNGVLTVTLPQKPEVKPRSIKVNA